MVITKLVSATFLKRWIKSVFLQWLRTEAKKTSLLFLQLLQQEVHAHTRAHTAGSLCFANSAGPWEKVCRVVRVYVCTTGCCSAPYLHSRQLGLGYISSGLACECIVHVILYCVCMQDSEERAPGGWLSKALVPPPTERFHAACSYLSLRKIFLQTF